MEWILLSLGSAFFLGLYDVAKKLSVRENAVPPVLLLNVATAALIWTPIVLATTCYPEPWAWSTIQPQSLTLLGHGQLAFKSVLVSASWTLAFYALKHLPISIAVPIRATSPFWTIIVAVGLLGERPSTTQWLGVLIVLIAFIAFSRTGRSEGIHFHRDRWVACMLGATVLGALSGLYDKYLLQTVRFSPATVQAWFSIYLVPTMLPMAIRWYARDRETAPFDWRWSIPLIAVTLLIADFLYFHAVSHPEALISVISPVRRTSVAIPFIVGIFWWSEKNWRRKAACIAAMLAGIYWISQ